MAMTDKIMLGRQNDLGLFVCRHALGRATERAMSSQANFDENQGVAIYHNQVDFAKTAAIVLIHCAQAV